MAGSNINRVILTGNLTKDPDLRTLANSGQSVCTLRIACNGRRRNSEGQWEDVPNYFDITVWGAQGENCGRYLSKGRGVAIDGRLRWRQWTDEKTQQKRSAVDIIADTVQFLGGRDDTASGNGNGNGFSSSVREAESDIPIDTGDFVSAPAGSGAADDDIPF
jgi:single-strand DNA-binding protein